MEEKAPKHKRSMSDTKFGEDIKECIFATPLQQNLGMEQQKRSGHEYWEKQAAIPKVCKQDRQKPAEDLIKEIATLEMQVVQLEQHLLSLYRKKFEQQVSPQTSSTRFLSEGAEHDIRERRRDDNLNFSRHLADQHMSSMLTKKNEFVSTSARFFSEHNWKSSFLAKDLGMQFNSARFSSDNCLGDIKAKKDDKLELSNDSDHSISQNFQNPAKKGSEKWGEQKILDSSINRTHSSLSQNFAVKYSTIQRVVAEAAQSDHSLPLSIFEYDSSDATCQNKHYDDHETPNWLSEEMIKCISAIYFRLADPQFPDRDMFSSPPSFTSSMRELSPENLRFSRTYHSMIEVKNISQDSKRLLEADHILQRFRALVIRLNKVDPRKLKHRQKLAFWINVHNALAMHAFLVYGIPENNWKRMSLVLKTAYNVGGQTLNLEMIQRSLLRCCLPRPGQWLQSFLFPKTRLKASDPRWGFAIDHSEPLLHFALCSGSQSDPAVRVYTPMRVFQELEEAKDNYIQLGLRVQNEHKILLPKTVELFAKDCELKPAGFMELLKPFLPASLRRSTKANLWKSIQWIPHNFAFRYLFAKELVA